VLAIALGLRADVFLLMGRLDDDEDATVAVTVTADCDRVFLEGVFEVDDGGGGILELDMDVDVASGAFFELEDVGAFEVEADVDDFVGFAPLFAFRATFDVKAEVEAAAFAVPILGLLTLVFPALSFSLPLPFPSFSFPFPFASLPFP
jgi:hypothetical protein